MASGWRLEIGSVLVKLRLWAEQNVVPVQKGHFSSTIIAPLERALSAAEAAAEEAPKSSVPVADSVPADTAEPAAEEGAAAAAEAGEACADERAPTPGAAAEGPAQTEQEEEKEDEKEPEAVEEKEKQEEEKEEKEEEEPEPSQPAEEAPSQEQGRRSSRVRKPVSVYSPGKEAARQAAAQAAASQDDSAAGQAASQEPPAAEGASADEPKGQANSPATDHDMTAELATEPATEPMDTPASAASPAAGPAQADSATQHTDETMPMPMQTDEPTQAQGVDDQTVDLGPIEEESQLQVGPKPGDTQQSDADSDSGEPGLRKPTELAKPKDSSASSLRLDWEASARSETQTQHSVETQPLTPLPPQPEISTAPSQETEDPEPAQEGEGEGEEEEEGEEAAASPEAGSEAPKDESNGQPSSPAPDDDMTAELPTEPASAPAASPQDGGDGSVIAGRVDPQSVGPAYGAAADANHDGRVTRSETAAYREDHPKPDAASLASPKKAPASAAQPAAKPSPVKETVCSQEFLSSLQSFGQSLGPPQEMGDLLTAATAEEPAMSQDDGGASSLENRVCSTQEGSEYLAALACPQVHHDHEATGPRRANPSVMDGLFAGSESQEDPAGGETQGHDDAPPAEQPKASDASQEQAEHSQQDDDTCVPASIEEAAQSDHEEAAAAKKTKPPVPTADGKAVTVGSGLRPRSSRARKAVTTFDPDAEAAKPQLKSKEKPENPSKRKKAPDQVAGKGKVDEAKKPKKDDYLPAKRTVPSPSQVEESEDSQPEEDAELQSGSGRSFSQAAAEQAEAEAALQARKQQEAAAKAAAEAAAAAVAKQKADEEAAKAQKEKEEKEAQEAKDAAAKMQAEEAAAAAAEAAAAKAQEEEETRKRQESEAADEAAKKQKAQDDDAAKEEKEDKDEKAQGEKQAKTKKKRGAESQAKDEGLAPDPPARPSRKSQRRNVTPPPAQAKSPVKPSKRAKKSQGAEAGASSGTAKDKPKTESKTESQQKAVWANAVSSPEMIRAHLTGFEASLKASLKSQLVELGVTVVDDVSDVSDIQKRKVTHLIAPSQSRNMKKLAAQATQRWVLSDSWVTACTAAGKLLPEQKYGARGSAPTIAGRSFEMESAFKLQHATTAVNAGALTKLITFCGGAVMRRAGSTAADYKLVAERRGRPCKASGGGATLTLEGFLALASGARSTRGTAKKRTPARGEAKVASARHGTKRKSGKGEAAKPEGSARRRSRRG